MFIPDSYCSFKDAIDRPGRAKFPNDPKYKAQPVEGLNIIELFSKPAMGA